MLMISFNMIKDRDPCLGGWRKLIKSKGGAKGLDRDKLFPLVDILDSNGLLDAAWCLRCIPGEDQRWDEYKDWCIRLPGGYTGLTRNATVWYVVDEIINILGFETRDKFTSLSMARKSATCLLEAEFRRTLLEEE